MFDQRYRSALTACAGVLACLLAQPGYGQTRESAESIPSPRLKAEPVPAASMLEEKPIGLLGVDISQQGDKFPENEAARMLAGQPVLAGNTPRPWPIKAYQWKPACTRHQPLYFEEINAERYGYSCCCCLQPVISTAHFFGTIPALPYLKAADCPWECQYTLGHYRPGSCNPHRFHCWPCSPRGLAAEAGVATALVFLLP